MTLKLKNNILKLCLSFLLLFSIAFLLCGCGKKYKYNGEVYEDSYDYKNDYGYIYLEKTDKKVAKVYEELYMNMVDFNHKKQDVSEKDYKTLFLKGNLTDGPFIYDDLYKAYMYLTAWHPDFYWMNYYIEDNGNYSLGISKPYIKNSDREKFDKKVNEELEKIDKLIENITDEYDRIKFLSDYIMDNMYYAFENGVPSQSEWAHNIIGFFDRGTGVCESYAKVFKLLCDRYNIGNIPVTSEDHIWNLVEYQNEWYVFDLTFSDDSNYLYFGKTEDFYNDKAHEYVKNLYELPENKATMPLTLGTIKVKENGNTIYSTHSMDHAFSCLNNGNYEIVMECISDKTMTDFYMNSISSNYTTLTISSNQNSNEHMTLELGENISLTKDLTISNVFLYSTKRLTITLNGNTLNLKNCILGDNIIIEGDSINYIN